MLGTPLSFSIIISKDKSHLYQSFSNDAEYLYQTNDAEFNLGKTSLQCGRRNNALKLWTLWKSVSSEGLEKIVNHQFYWANVARLTSKSNPSLIYIVLTIPYLCVSIIRISLLISYVPNFMNMPR